MFTGLVEGVGEIVGLTPQAEGLRLAVKTSFPAAELTLGESVAVAGACLTVVAIEPPAASFEVSPETLARTTFPLKKVGDRVNLERALDWATAWAATWSPATWTASGWCGSVRPGPAHTQLQFELPAALSRFVIEKGSIAVDGVSLTVNSLPGQHLHGERHPPHRQGDHPGRPARWGTGSTWKRTSSASTWPGCWVRDGPAGRGGHRGAAGPARVFVSEQ